MARCYIAHLVSSLFYPHYDFQIYPYCWVFTWFIVSGCHIILCAPPPWIGTRVPRDAPWWHHVQQCTCNCCNSATVNSLVCGPLWAYVILFCPRPFSPFVTWIISIFSLKVGQFLAFLLHFFKGYILNGTTAPCIPCRLLLWFHIALQFLICLLQ